MQCSRLILIMTLCCSTHALAGGYAIPEQSASMTAKGTVGAASSDNPSTIYSNPAGITKLKGLQLYLGTTLVSVNSELTQDVDGIPVKAKTVAHLAPVPHLYATYQINELFSAGLGLYAPYGLGMEWEEGYPQRSDVTEQNLRAPFITLAAGINLDRWLSGLSLALTGSIIPTQVLLKKDIPFGREHYATSQVGGKTFGGGGSVGILYEAENVEGLRFGLVYKSPVELKATGVVDFDSDPEYRASLPPDGEVKASITLPQTVSFGVSYDVIDAFNVETQIDFFGWSVYDELRLDLPNDVVSISPRNWTNTLTFRLGIEYDFSWAKMRAGYIFDNSPVPAETLTASLPDGTRHMVTAGAGFDLPYGFTVDIGALYIVPFERSASDKKYEPLHKADFKARGVLASLSIGYKYDFAPAETAPVEPPPAAEAPPAAQQPPAAGENETGSTHHI